MLLKNGVKVKGIKPELVMGILLTESLWKLTLRTNDPIVITSITDGKHSVNSLHYKGLGFDVRTKFLTSSQKSIFFDALKKNMDLEFDIVMEDSHIHIEFDPK